MEQTLQAGSFLDFLNDSGEVPADGGKPDDEDDDEDTEDDE